MLSKFFSVLRLVWLAASLAFLGLNITMLWSADPEQKKHGAVLLLANLAQTWLFFHDKTMQWLQRTWKTKGEWERRTVLDTLYAVGGIGFMSTLIALGAFILFAETCLPFKI
jgi:hypothetical protein